MWHWYALTAMGCFATMQLIFTYLNRKGVAPAVTLLWVFAFGALFYVGHMRVTRTPMPVAPSSIALMVVAAALAYVGNLSSVRSLTLAPNPGYAVALVSMQAAVVTLVAIAIFGLTVTWMKGLGVLLCCLGIALLVV
jgi:hypothetical protein